MYVWMYIWESECESDFVSLCVRSCVCVSEYVYPLVVIGYIIEARAPVIDADTRWRMTEDWRRSMIDSNRPQPLTSASSDTKSL